MNTNNTTITQRFHTVSEAVAWLYEGSGLWVGIGAQEQLDLYDSLEEAGRASWGDRVAVVRDTVGICHASYDRGHTPEWTLKQTPTAVLAAKYSCTTEDVWYHFDGRSEQSGAKSLRIWRENCEWDEMAET